MKPAIVMTPELGKVTPYLEVPELIVRMVPCYGVTSEFDGGDYDSISDEEPDNTTQNECRLQGRIVNSTIHKLSSIQYDLSYYDKSGEFLGLDKSRFLDDDELDAEDHLPIDMKVQPPENTSRCIFNVRALKTGLFGRLFWG